MTLDLNTRMAEAINLTRTGRLAEATALLRGLSRKEGSPEASQLIDMVPTRSGFSQSTAPGVVHSSRPSPR